LIVKFWGILGKEVNTVLVPALPGKYTVPTIKTSTSAPPKCSRKNTVLYWPISAIPARTGWYWHFGQYNKKI